MIIVWRRESQQLRQGNGTGLMHRRADRRLDALQIQAASGLTLTEDYPKQLLYLTADLLLDDLRCFFSWSVCLVCSIGRNRQIFRLTSTNSLDSA